MTILTTMTVCEVAKACLALKRNKGRDTLHVNLLTQIHNRALQDKEFSDFVDFELSCHFQGGMAGIEAIDDYLRKPDPCLAGYLRSTGVADLAKRFHRQGK